MLTDANVLKLVSYMICMLALASVREHTSIPVSNTLFYYVGAYTTLIACFYYLFKDKYYKQPVYMCVLMYLLWAIICIVRGFFVIETYWVFNQMIRGFMQTLVPMLIFLFVSPSNCIKIFRVVNRFIPIVGIILMAWAIPLKAYSFYCVPFFTLYILFLKDVKSKWLWVILAAFVIVFISVENRSGSIKASFALLIFFLSLTPHLLRNLSFTIMHWLLYFSPIILIYLGATGQYNLFDPHMTEKSISITVKYDGNEKRGINEDYTQDTRTFIYIESFESAIENDHLWLGRTPARGYSSPFFYELNGKHPDAKGIDDDERFESEVGHMNTFIWQGIVGVVLIFFLYLHATILALYKSRNKYVKMLGVFVAFMWAYGWIENPYHFLMLDITIFLMIAICYSPEFRKMNDLEFKLFINDLFEPPSKISSLLTWNLLKHYFIISKYKQLKNH